VAFALQADDNQLLRSPRDPASDILLPLSMRSTHTKESVLPSPERVNIAVFIDFDNIEIGVRTTLSEHFDIGIILEALKERGEVVTQIAYADWTRAGEYSRALTQHAIRLVQRNLTPGGDKNGADINLALDALEMAFTHPHINAYVIVGGDSDFLSLVEKLKQYDKKVFVVGGRAFTSVILQRNCHEFIAYENLMRKPTAARGGRPVATPASSPIAHAFPIVRRALKILADREVTPQTGLLKSTLLQLDSTFSERNYGASSFLDFVEKLAKAGLVQLKHAGRSTMVELSEHFVEDAEGAEAADTRPAPPAARTAPAAETAELTPARVPRAGEPGRSSPDGDAGQGQTGRTATGEDASGESDVVQAGAAPPPPVDQIGDNAEGVTIAGQVIAAATNARWPMYLRNVKQILRAGGFDERRYGFGGLMEILRACQKDGLIRMERDRRGGLRVFQGPALSRGAAALPQEMPRQQAVEVADPTPIDVTFEPMDFGAAADVEVERQPAIVVDTTAELLGRSGAKSRRSSRIPRTAAAAPRKAAPKKTAAVPSRRSPRSRKAVEEPA
jgi:uncharacterized LabA/DUF88 family protein